MAQRTLVITDIHGCYDEMMRLLEKMHFNSASDVLICLGDTIDRGPKIYEVFQFLLQLREVMGRRLILVRGNHEQMMLDATDEELSASERRDNLRLWYYNSGQMTVQAFERHGHPITEFRSFYTAMPLYYVDNRFNAAHASMREESPADNDPETLLWGRGTEYTGKLVLTGHTPYKFPLWFLGDGSGKSAYARIPEGKPCELMATGTMALDTGCVFGNRLTGIIIEDRRFVAVSVDSRYAAK